MAEYVVLDSGPLGLSSRNPNHPRAAPVHRWMNAILARGADIVVPEITDYELRRELTRIAAHTSLQRLDRLVTTGGLIYAPITTDQMRQAAMLWADARQQGIPTAHQHALDADVILAACATTIGQPGDQVIVATDNVGHLARYCDARLWTTIT
jgi:predicted nucleic acid-binding protein